MPNAADCYAEHARQVNFCVTQFVANPWAMCSCIGVADFNLSMCLAGINPDPVTQLVEAITDVADALFRWAQQNPSAAAGAVVIIGTVTAVLVFGPGGLAFAFI